MSQDSDTPKIQILKPNPEAKTQNYLKPKLPKSPKTKTDSKPKTPKPKTTQHPKPKTIPKSHNPRPKCFG